MNELEKETIYGQVIAKANNYIAVPDGNGGRRIIKNEKIRRYEASFSRQCKIYRNRKINGQFALFVKIFYPSKACDLDNSLKTVLDCLQYVGAITDDKLCVQIHAEKGIDTKRPRVVFAIKELQGNLF